RLQSLHRISNRHTSQALTAGPIDRPFRRRMADQHAFRWAVLQQLLGLLFGEVITPGAERGNRDAAADTEKLDSTNRNSRSVQDMSLWPILASLHKFLGGFIVAGHQHRRLVNRPKHVDANAD